MTYRSHNDDDDEPMFVPINALHTRFLKLSDAVNLNDMEKLQLDELLMSHDIVFGRSEQPTSYAVHKIDTGNHEQFFSPPYRLSVAKARELERKI